MTYRQRIAVRRTKCPKCEALPGKACVGRTPGSPLQERATPHAARLEADREQHPIGGARPGAGRKATGPTDEARVQLPGPRVASDVRDGYLELCAQKGLKPAQFMRVLVEAAVARARRKA